MSTYKACHFCGHSLDHIKSEFLTELTNHRGNITNACEAMEISRGRINSMRKADDAFNIDVENIRLSFKSKYAGGII